MVARTVLVVKNLYISFLLPNDMSVFLNLGKSIFKTILILMLSIRKVSKKYQDLPILFSILKVNNHNVKDF